MWLGPFYDSVHEASGESKSREYLANNEGFFGDEMPMGRTIVAESLDHDVSMGSVDGKWTDIGEKPLPTES